MKAAIYCRISSDPDHDELGVKRQEADCRALCEHRGWGVAEVFTDDDRSAYSGKRRPRYEAMLQALRDGTVNAIVAWHPDRLTRHPRELEDLIVTIETTKARLATVQAGEYDLSTASGRMTARVVGAVARGESEHKSARLKRKHRELAEAGKLSGGGRAYGYWYDLDPKGHIVRVSVVESEKVILEEIAGRLLAGETLRGVTADLNRRGVPTVTGKPWSTVVVKRMMTAPRWVGLRVHDGATFKATSWEPIITVADHRRLVALLTDPARNKKHHPRRYLLTGLLVRAS
jgi:DNA invertase Pin-like site-specific DNA recombinase